MLAVELEKYYIHPLIVKYVWHGGGKRYWLEEEDTRLPVAHMGNHKLSAPKYAYLFRASPLLLASCELILMKYELDTAIRELVTHAIRQTTPLP